MSRNHSSRLSSVLVIFMLIFIFMTAFVACDDDKGVIDASPNTVHSTSPPKNTKDHGSNGANPTGSMDTSHGPNWDYGWGWGSGPRSGWGFGYGSGHSPTGFARGFGFGYGSGSGSGSGSGYGYGSGGGATGYGYGSGGAHGGSGGGGGSSSNHG